MLEINKLPSYLSPSSLMQALTQPNTFYLTRLIDPPYPREEQGLAAAVGSAFDYYIKIKMIEERFKEKKIFLDELRNGIESNTVEAHQAGKKCLSNYIQGAYNPLEFADIEIHKQVKIEGIPIYGKLDATSYDLRSVSDPLNSFEEIKKLPIIPFDWKVSGYTSKSGVSPKKYYYRLWETFKPKQSHKDFQENIPFEMIDEKWATQLCTYGWIIGKPLLEPFASRIDMLCWRKGTIRTAQYRGIITKEFQENVLNNYIQVWKEIMNGSFVQRLDSTRDINLVYVGSTNETWF